MSAYRFVSVLGGMNMGIYFNPGNIGYRSDISGENYSKGCDSRDIFEKFEVATTNNWDRYLNKFNVIHLDMSTFAGKYDKSADTAIKQIKEKRYAEKIMLAGINYDKTTKKYECVIEEYYENQ